MAHGITLELREITRPTPTFLHEHAPAVKVVGGWAKPKGLGSHVNPDRDRALSGKARRRARKAARGLARHPFFKGHGVASENAYNQRYDCPCGYGIIAPLDDFDFMTEVMDHELEHAEAGAA